MTACRGCGAPIPPRLYWPNHCGPKCMNLAVERVIKTKMKSRPDAREPAPRKVARVPLFCEWCNTLLPSDRTRWCSHKHRRAWQARERGETGLQALEDDAPLWRALEDL